MAMLDVDQKAVPEQERPLRIDPHALRPHAQARCDVDRQSAVVEPRVSREVLALEVGVDRHLEPTASANRRDEVQRDHSAALAREVHGSLSQFEFHVDQTSGARRGR